MKHFGYCIFGIIFLLISSSVLGNPAEKHNSSRYWVFFRDKGENVKKLKKAHIHPETIGLTERAIKRRLKVKYNGNLMDERDLLVSQDYIETLENFNLKSRIISRWLNLVSVEIPDSLLEMVRILPYIKKIRRLSSVKIEVPHLMPISKATLTDTSATHLFDYGGSYIQNDQIGVPEVHDLGLTGKDILIGMIDSGFDYKDRIVFSKLHVVSEYDFHWEDEITSNEKDDPSDQHDHGTSVLSVIGGFDEGYHIGPAFGASYLLAKTEWVPISDLWVELEHWIMALEWMERMGVDIVSSSLGYYTFVDTVDYSYEDLDGNTCIATVAADIAASKGVLIFTSAGNERNKSWHYITFPADGDSVMAVGAVDFLGNLVSFSSVGPTSDGRIKPDVVAMGLGVSAVTPWSGLYSTYYFIGGTSLACPLAAGVGALILEAHPELGPMQIRDAIRNTADRAMHPDTLYGWGLVNAYDAVFYHGMVFMDFEAVYSPPDNFSDIATTILSGSGLDDNSIFLYYTCGDEDAFQKVQMEKRGENRFMCKIPVTINQDCFRFYISAIDTTGEKYHGPIGAPELLYSFADTSVEIIKVKTSYVNRFYLYQNYPNPFNDVTTIDFEILNYEKVIVKIINIRGQEVCTLLDTILDMGRYRLVWKGRDYNGKSVPSGIYFCVMISGRYKDVRKMMLIR